MLQIWLGWVCGFQSLWDNEIHSVWSVVSCLLSGLSVDYVEKKIVCFAVNTKM